MQDAFLKQDKRYWENRFATAPDISAFPADHKPAAVAEGSHDTCLFELEAETTRRLMKISRQSDETALAVLLTAAAVLLHRYTGNRRVAVKTATVPTAGEHPAAPNLLLLESQVEQEGLLKDLLLQTLKNVSEACRHRTYPYELLLQHLSMQQADSSRLPALLYQCTAQEIQTACRYSDMVFAFSRTGEAGSCTVSYDPALYSESTVRGLCEQYTRVLEQLLTNPDSRVADLELLTAAGQHRIIYAFNETARTYTAANTILDLVACSVKDKASQTAISYQEQERDYSWLHHRAACLAQHLLSKGLTKGTLVGVLMEPSIDFMVSVLGVLMAGGVYLPIDVHYPAERKRYILADTGLAYILSASQYIYDDMDLLQHIDFDKIIDAGDEGMYEEEAAVDLPEMSRSDLAYIIYTSGSTGHPKGVMVDHGSLLNYLCWAREIYAKDRACSMPLFTSIAFDLTITSLFLPLITGGAVHIYSAGSRHDVPLEQILTAGKVTIMKLTPAHLKIMKEGGWRSNALECLVVGGEQLSAALAQHIYEFFDGHVRVYNEYGPTEATVGCMTYEYQPAAAARAESVLVGRPAPNCEIYILDGHYRPQPFGAPGEIFIGGLQLSRGYFRNEELTAAKFVRHPFREGAVLYSTGDFGKMYSDGNILFTGRKDDQVKIRGYRVELGEITYALQQHEKVTDALVVVKGHHPDNRQLNAYYVCSEDPGQEQLRAFLEERLPAYMIPDFFIRLPEMPLTQNGKIDREALPAPGIMAVQEDAAPASTLEMELISIWSEVLDLSREQLGVTTSFFHIGGHSLKALSLTFFISRKLGVQVEVGDILRHPTIRQLAQYIAGRRHHHRDETLVAAEKMDAYPLSPAQERMYVLQQLDAAATVYNMPFLFSWPAGSDLSRLQHGMEQLVARHESLRTFFVSVGGRIYQRILDTVAIQPEMIDAGQRSLPEVLKEFVRPFDLSRPPLVRIGYLYNLENAAEQLVIDMHHIINDGISQEILEQDFKALFEGKPLPPVTCQYKDYIQWLQRKSARSVLEKNEQYWLQELSGTLPVLELPYDYTRPRQQQYDGGMLSMDLDPDTFQKIKQLCAGEDATIFMWLLSLWKVLLSRLSGQEELLVGIPVSGRTRGALEKIVGMFVNTLVIRSQPAATSTWRQYFRNVKEKLLLAYEHQEYPFELLVNHLAKERDMSRSPLFSVAFNYFNHHNIWDKEEDSRPPGEIREETALAAKYDLTLSAVEREEGITLRLEYSKALFSAATAERYLRYFHQLVNTICREPDIVISDIELLLPGEAALLKQWNNTAVEYDLDTTVIACIEEKAESSPYITILFEEEHYFSYAFLNRQANIIAHSLSAAGVKKGDAVAVMLTASFGMYAAFLGVLKAGAILVPVDSSYPAERRERIIANSGAACTITQALLDNMLQEGGNASNPPLVAGPQDIAYMIYTSGTTGIPNGVKITHRSLLNLCLWHNRFYAVTGRDRAAKYAKTGFDATIWEIFPYLVQGAAAYIVDEAVKYDMPHLSKRYELLDITIGFLPTPIAEEFMQVDNSSLRCLLTGGDRLKKASPEKLGYALYNNYGPTEYTVVATAHPVEEAQANIPIGRPVYNTQIYILHPRGNVLQPPGVTGELCIAGAGLAAGYHDNDDLTQQKFVKGAWEGAEMVYRTGDLARWTMDGVIEYLGRKDTQVKLRGYRIELGEIENMLNSYPGISNSLACIHTHNGEDSLCAYYVADAALQKAGLAAYLRRRLPEYMVPVSFNYVPGFPLGVNEKVDMKALPLPVFESAERYVSPAEGLEQQLTEIWAGILGLAPARIGTRHNFFELGGNSMKVVRLRAALQETLNLQLPVVALFEHPTIAGLAGYISRSNAAAQQEQHLQQKAAEESAGMLEQTLKIIGNI